VSSALSAWQPLGDGRWRATWLEDGAPVVVKCWPVPPGVSARARLDAQVAATAALGTATPHVYWRDILDDAIWSVVRWEHGTPPQPPLSPTHPVFTAWLAALDSLHAAGLVHRDVCPRNTLVGAEGQVWLLDLEEVVPAGADADVVGTPGFVAPEVARGGAATPSADLFALGQVLDGESAPVLVALATAWRPEWRAASGVELRRALPLPEAAPAFTGAVRGPDALHGVPGQVATLRAHPDGPRWLDRLCVAGFGRVDPDGGRTVHPVELHRWQALLVSDASVAANRARVEAGAPGVAVWSLLHHPSASDDDWLDTLGMAALHTHDPGMLRRVRAELRCLALPPHAGAQWWCTLLEAALAVHVGRSAEALEAVDALSNTGATWRRMAHEVVRMRAAMRLGPTRARAVLDTLPAAPLDPDAPARRQAWVGLLAYQSGAFDDAVEALSEAWPQRVCPHDAAFVASNLASVWLHLDAPDRAETVARDALARLTPGAHPFAAARLAAKMREAVYRGHDHPTPDLDLLAAISVASPPFAVALATLNEAAAAWRAGDFGPGAALAHEAAERFDHAGLVSGHVLAGALAHRMDHPAWVRATDRLEAAVDDILDEARGVWLPAVAAQVLGLLASGPDDPLIEEARELAQESGRPLAPRREILSLEEAGTGAYPAVR